MDENIIKQLADVYGKKKAKKIVKKVRSIKKKHPNIIFSFIFDEEGNVQALPKEERNEQQQGEK